MDVFICVCIFVYAVCMNRCVCSHGGQKRVLGIHCHSFSPFRHGLSLKLGAIISQLYWKPASARDPPVSAPTRSWIFRCLLGVQFAVSVLDSELVPRVPQQALSTQTHISSAPSSLFFFFLGQFSYYVAYAS